MKPNFSWYITMAWRDSRRQRGKLLLFVSSIVLGIAALVSITTFIENVQGDIDDEAREILGADLVVRDNRKLDSSIDSLILSKNYQVSKSIRFNSMLGLVKKDGTRLVNVYGIDKKYPFYGELEGTPQSGVESFRTGNEAALDQSLLIQFDLEVGDSISLGKQKFKIATAITGAPGQTGFASAVAPSVYIPIQYVDSTGLLAFGSRLSEYRYLLISNENERKRFAEQLTQEYKNGTLRVQTFEERSERSGQAAQDAGSFLNLVAFIALLLGCIGIVSTVNIYLKSKYEHVAVLSCIGLPAKKAFNIYFIQVAIFGFIGSALGAVLGSVLAYFLPIVLSDFLPVDVSYSISWTSMGFGVFIGMTVSLLFTLEMLFKLSQTSPLLAIRSFAGNIKLKTFQSIVLRTLILLFVFLFSLYLTESWLNSFFFTLGCAVVFLLLLAMASILRWTAKKLVNQKWTFVLKQAVANLYRPNNQSTTLIATIGMGVTLIAILIFSQDMLLSKVSFKSNADDPNMIIFGVQTTQVHDIVNLVENNSMPVLAKVPIITIRLDKLRGESKSHYFPEGKETEESLVEDHVFNREWRVSYRDSLTESEEIIEGEFISKYSGEGLIPVTVSEGNMEYMNASVGDHLTFNVQGAAMECYIAGVRRVNWNQVATNFTILFPEGVLNKAPKTFVVLTRTPNATASAEFQQQLIKAVPTISIVDLNFIIKTVSEIIDKLKFVILFMSLFSIVTGFVVLVGSLFNSRFQRMKESVLLKTIGASQKQISRINLIEYALIGVLAALTGIIIALGASYLLSAFFFKAIFVPSASYVFALIAGITFTVIFIGYLNSRSIFKKTAIEILRESN